MRKVKQKSWNLQAIRKRIIRKIKQILNKSKSTWAFNALEYRKKRVNRDIDIIKLASAGKRSEKGILFKLI